MKLKFKFLLLVMSKLDPTINYEDDLYALEFCSDLQPYIEKIKRKISTHSTDKREHLLRLIMLVITNELNNTQPGLDDIETNPTITNPTDLESDISLQYDLEPFYSCLNTYLQTDDHVMEQIPISQRESTSNTLPVINDLYKVLNYVEYLQKASQHFKQKRLDFNNIPKSDLESLNRSLEDGGLKDSIAQHQATIQRLREEELMESGQWDNHRTELELKIKEGINRIDALGKEMDNLLHEVINQSKELVHGETIYQGKITELKNILQRNEREIAHLKKVDWLLDMKIQSSRYVDTITSLYNQYANYHYDVYFEAMDGSTKWAQINLKRQHKIYTSRVTQMLQETASQCVLVSDSMCSTSTVSNGTQYQSDLSTSIAEATSLASHWEDIHHKMSLYKTYVSCDNTTLEETTSPKIFLQHLLQLLLKSNEEFCKLYEVHDEDPSSGELVARDLFHILSQIKLQLLSWSSYDEQIQPTFWCNQIRKARLNLMENFQLYGGELSGLLTYSFSNDQPQNIYQLMEHNMKLLSDLLDERETQEDHFDLASRSTSGDSFFNVQVD